MKYAFVFCLLVLASVTLGATPDAPNAVGPQLEMAAPRYGVPVDLQTYPQGSPQETIRSVIRATKTNNVDYLLAQLVVPREVDAKFQGNTAALRALASVATPEKSKQMTLDLQRHLNDGTWTIRRDRAVSHVDGVADLALERIGRRWYMNNRTHPERQQ